MRNNDKEEKREYNLRATWISFCGYKVISSQQSPHYDAYGPFRCASVGIHCRSSPSCLFLSGRKSADDSLSFAMQYPSKYLLISA